MKPAEAIALQVMPAEHPYFPYNTDLVKPKLEGSTSMPSVSVTSADFQKNFGRYRETAIREAVTITNHGRDSFKFTYAGFVGQLAAAGVRVSMDGKGRFLDNISSSGFGAA
jgi:hypothetical protein